MRPSVHACMWSIEPKIRTIGGLQIVSCIRTYGCFSPLLILQVALRTREESYFAFAFAVVGVFFLMYFPRISCTALRYATLGGGSNSAGEIRRCCGEWVEISLKDAYL